MTDRHDIRPSDLHDERRHERAPDDEHDDDRSFAVRRHAPDNGERDLRAEEEGRSRWRSVLGW